jgi:pimeloyl-ACP methyl ester carboxylesterase
MAQRCAVQDVLIVWGDHDQLFPLEKGFAVQRYSVLRRFPNFCKLVCGGLGISNSAPLIGFCPLQNIAVFFRSLNGSARMEVIKNTGHAPQVEDPARFNKVMLDFLLAAHKPDPSVNGGSH